MGNGQGSSRASTWYGRWNVNNEGVDPADTRPRIWNVEYRLAERTGAIDQSPVDLTLRRTELYEAIADARAFPQGDELLSTFASWFDEALTLGSRADAVPTWHPDLLPHVGYSLEARQLLAMGIKGLGVRWYGLVERPRV